MLYSIPKLDWQVVLKNGAQSKVGIEKEGLRTTAGRLATTPHPREFGHKLCHPNITTDFSESLLELVTEPYSTVTAAIERLEYLHANVQYILNKYDEQLWAGSMPVRIDDDNEIDIASYGPSYIARAKEIYRRGLSVRYGKRMQIIAGIHCNISFDTQWIQQLHVGNQLKDNRKNYDKNDMYFHIIRNYRRVGWLVGYLFGSTCGFDRSLINNARLRQSNLQLRATNTHTLVSATAHSLRMSSLGYSSSIQANFEPCLNDISDYISSMHQGLAEPVDTYRKIGQKKNGEYAQLSTNLLQIENEFYTLIRPKNSQSNVRPVRVLMDSGVEYIELRNIDVNPLLPLGIDESTITFLVLLIHSCLFAPSPRINAEECHSIRKQFIGIATGTLAMKTVTAQCIRFLQDLLPMAEHMGATFVDAVAAQIYKVNNPKMLPANIVRSKLMSDRIEHNEYIDDLSNQHQQRLLQIANRSDFAELAQKAQRSDIDAAELWRQQTHQYQSFEGFYEDYFRI